MTNDSSREQAMLEPPLAEFLTATRWIGRMMGASPSEAADVENGNIQSLLSSQSQHEDLPGSYVIFSCKQ